MSDRRREALPLSESMRARHRVRRFRRHQKRY